MRRRPYLRSSMWIVFVELQCSGNFCQMSSRGFTSCSTGLPSLDMRCDLILNMAVRSKIKEMLKSGFCSQKTYAYNKNILQVTRKGVREQEGMKENMQQQPQCRISAEENVQQQPQCRPMRKKMCSSNPNVESVRKEMCSRNPDTSSVRKKMCSSNPNAESVRKKQQPQCRIRVCESLATRNLFVYLFICQSVYLCFYMYLCLPYNGRKRGSGPTEGIM